MRRHERMIDLYVVVGLTTIVLSLGSRLVLASPQSSPSAPVSQEGASTASPPAAQEFFNTETPPTSPATMDLKANGSDGPVTEVNGVDVVFTWTTSDPASTCTINQLGVIRGAASGQASWKPPTGQNVVIAACANAQGVTVTDSVTVTVTPRLTPLPVPVPYVAPITTGGGEGGPSVVLSKPAPVVRYIAPSDGSEVKGLLRIRVRATRPNGYAADMVQFYVDGSSVSREITSYAGTDEWAGKDDAGSPAIFFAVWDTTRAADGVHTIVARASADGVEQAASITVTVKNGPSPAPTIETAPITTETTPITTTIPTPTPRADTCDTTARAVVDAVGGCSKIDTSASPDVYAACCKVVTKAGILQILNDALADGVLDAAEKLSLLTALNDYLSGKPSLTIAQPTSATSKLPNVTIHQQAGWSNLITARPYSLEDLLGQKEKDDAPVHVGDDLMVHFNIANNGTGPTDQPFTLDAYLDGTLIKKLSQDASLMPGQMHKFLVIIKAPTAGNHVFKIVMDPTNAIHESTESDNGFSRNMTVLPSAAASVGGSRDTATESFRDSCNVISEDDNDIVASCKRISGSWVRATYHRVGCSTDIANNNGSIICQAGGGGGGGGSSGGGGSTCNSSKGTLNLSINAGSYIVIDGYTLDSSGRYSFEGGYTYGCFGYDRYDRKHSCTSVTIRPCQTTNVLVRWD